MARRRYLRSGPCLTIFVTTLSPNLRVPLVKGREKRRNQWTVLSGAGVWCGDAVGCQFQISISIPSFSSVIDLFDFFAPKNDFDFALLTIQIWYNERILNPLLLHNMLLFYKVHNVGFTKPLLFTIYDVFRGFHKWRPQNFRINKINSEKYSSVSEYLGHI